jgi:hypothetical protein
MHKDIIMLSFAEIKLLLLRTRFMERTVECFLEARNWTPSVHVSTVLNELFQLIERLKQYRIKSSRGYVVQRYSNFFVRVPPEYIFSSTLYPQSCFCIIQVIRNLHLK